MAYDIFISYRRRGGFETAKHLYDLLTKDGYRVSFDIDTLRNGDFDTELLRRIDECRDFILILSEGALDRCVDPSAVASADWVRCELAYALEKNKNIVPIMLAGFTAFPDNLPDDIRKVVRKNGPKYDSYYFDDFYRRLKSDFLETKPEERGDEDAYVTQLLKRLSVLKSVPEPTDGQQAELGETYYELGRLASLHNRPDMLDYLPQALAIFRRLADKLGGSIASSFGRMFQLNEREGRIMTMCGMAAGFAALFGTPLTSVIFAMEVITVGVMHYSAIVPCIISALVAAGLSPPAIRCARSLRAPAGCSSLGRP